jgi:hypothetical protein
VHPHREKLLFAEDEECCHSMQLPRIHDISSNFPGYRELSAENLHISVEIPSIPSRNPVQFEHRELYSTQKRISIIRPRTMTVQPVKVKHAPA